MYTDYTGKIQEYIETIIGTRKNTKIVFISRTTGTSELIKEKQTIIINNYSFYSRYYIILKNNI